MKKHLICSTQIFFGEIGKYQPLTREEEVTEIENISKLKKILKIASASVNSSIILYLSLVKIRDRLAGKTGRKIHISQWALAAQISIEKLSLIKKAAYYEWALAAQITVSQLNSIEKSGRLAREKLILCNLYLVVKIAKSYQNRGLELLDLIQEGVIGLEYSIDRFDRTKGFRFTTYAEPWIKGFITKSIDEKSRMIRLPRNIIDLLSKIEKTRQKFHEIYKESPSLSTISDSLNISEQKIRSALEKNIRVSSVNVTLKIQDTQKELLDLIPAQDRDHEIEHISIQDTLQSLISNLEVRERQVIKFR
jgi:RNA polymerase nonessential primary-like sigma factor